MDTIDDDLPFIMNIFLSEAFEMLGTLVVLIISQPLLAVAFVPLAFIYRWIQVDPHAFCRSPGRFVYMLHRVAKVFDAAQSVACNLLTHWLGVQDSCIV